MPRNGLNESTSLRKATVKVTGSSAGASPASRRGAGASEAEQEAASAPAAGRVRCRLCPADRPAAPPPAVAPQQPHEHLEHGVERPDPYAWMAEAESPPSCSRTLRPNAPGTTRRRLIWTPWWRAALRDGTRVPDIQRSARWNRPRFSYYTRDAEKQRLPADLARKSSRFVPDDRDSRTETGPDNEFGSAAAERTSARARRERPRRPLRLPRPGAHHGQPRRDAARLRGRHHGDEVFTLRFRDLATGDDLAEVVDGVATTAAPGRADSRGFFYTVHDAAYRPYQVLAPPARHATPPTTCSCSRSPTSGSSCSRAAGPQRAGRAGARAESRDTTEAGSSTPAARTSAPRSVGGRRAASSTGSSTGARTRAGVAAPRHRRRRASSSG